MMNELRPEVAAHLAEDAASPEELRELQATLALLGALPQVAPRRTFILTPEQVADRPRRRAARRLAWVWPTRWATAIAAVCFAVTLGLGQGAAPEPAGTTAPVPTAAVALATATPTTIDEPQLTIFATPNFVEPVPTAVPVASIAPAPPVATGIDWRPTQFALGALTALGAFFGFVLPPFLRRRGTATA